MTALCTAPGLQALQFIYPNATIEIIDEFKTPEVSLGRFNEIQYQYKLKLDTGHTVQKQHLYQQLVREMFIDQLCWINDRTHIRKINADNAVNSLQMAEDSERIAIKIMNNRNGSYDQSF